MVPPIQAAPPCGGGNGAKIGVRSPRPRGDPAGMVGDPPAVAPDLAPASPSLGGSRAVEKAPMSVENAHSKAGSGVCGCVAVC